MTSRIIRIIRVVGSPDGLLAAVLAVSLALSGVVAAENDAEPRESSPGVPYTVEIEGVGNEKLHQILEATSQAVSFADRPPASVRGIDVRAEGDVERLETALRSEGYYDATVAYRIDSSSTPVKVVFEIAPGDRYHLQAYEIEYVGSGDTASLPRDVGLLGLKIGMPARAPAVVGAETTLLRLLGQQGYPRPSVSKREAIVDHADQTMRVTVKVDQGPYAVFGATRLEGLEDVREGYPRSLQTWTEGDVFDHRKLEEYRKALWKTELFSGVSFDTGQEIGPEGRLPIVANLVESAHRSIGAGGTYSTDEGFGVEGFWIHRNLFGAGERLETRLELAQIRQSLNASFRKPVFLHRDQSLLAGIAFTREDTDAFQGQTGSASVGVEREIDEGFKVSGGLTLEYSNLTDADETEERYFLVGVPLAASLDRTNDILNPESGYKATAQATPYYGTGDSTLSFVSASLAGAVYVPFDEDRRYVMAARAKVGTIFGADRDDVPANLRLYAGGGGSVRGYAFQSVGPLDGDNDPLGGNSLVEFALEMRVRVTDEIAVVPFVDAGNVYADSWPDLSEGLLWAAGLGVRYYTDIGPLRVDIATPINGRPSDDSFQFYVSLGQAF